MTSLDDQLHDLFSSARTPVDGATGDVDRVRSAVRRRQLRRRSTSLVLIAAVIVLAVGVTLASGRDGNAVRTGPGTEPTTPTTAPPRSTTSHPSSTTTTSSTGSATSTSTPTTSATTVAPPAGSLEPPDADVPAAGVCARADTSVVVVEVVLDPDVPSPRCTEVTADQRLVVRNATTEAVTVTLADFRVTVAPGESELLDRPFGQYLAPGVHRVSTGALYGGSGPEIWLKP
jgi:cytoskeletal protein RodZ